jgi:hypothetical protein
MRFFVIGVGALGILAAGCGSKSRAAGAWVTIDSAEISKQALADGESLDFSWRVSYTNDLGYVTDVGLYVGSKEAIAANAPDTSRLFNRAVTGNIKNDASESTVSCTRRGGSLSCGGAYYDLPANEAPLTFRACAGYVLSSEEVCDYRSFTISLP